MWTIFCFALIQFSGISKTNKREKKQLHSVSFTKFCMKTWQTQNFPWKERIISILSKILAKNGILCSIALEKMFNPLESDKEIQSWEMGYFSGKAIDSFRDHEWVSGGLEIRTDNSVITSRLPGVLPNGSDELKSTTFTPQKCLQYFFITQISSYA